MKTRIRYQKNEVGNYSTQPILVDHDMFTIFIYANDNKWMIVDNDGNTVRWGRTKNIAAAKRVAKAALKTLGAHFYEEIRIHDDNVSSAV